MDKVQFTPVYNRKNRLRKNGTALIQIEAYYRRKKKYFTTGIYIAPDQWDNKRRKIKGNHPNGIRLNIQIRDYITKLENIELKQRQSSKPFTLQFLTEQSKDNHATNFISYFHQKTEKLSRQTKILHQATFGHLERYSPNINFESVTAERLIGFEEYLRNTKGLHPNTIVKHFAILRKYLRQAMESGLYDANLYPFGKEPLKGIVKKITTIREHLTPDELKIFENTEIPKDKPTLQLVKDKFLFAVYTGLRYSDMAELKPDCVETMGNIEWLKIIMKKTKIKVSIPISVIFEGKGLKIFRQYAGKHKEHSVFPYQRNDKANYQLKKVIELTGIKKHITFHVARHTNATLLLHNEVSVSTIQSLLGHKRLETTQIYSKVMNITILKELQKVSYS